MRARLIYRLLSIEINRERHIRTCVRVAKQDDIGDACGSDCEDRDTRKGHPPCETERHDFCSSKWCVFTKPSGLYVPAGLYDGPLRGRDPESKTRVLLAA